VQKVLQNLLREGVSIRDLATVLETLADHAPRTKDPDALTEHARQALGRAITRRFLGPDGTLALVTLAAPVERLLLDALQRTDEGTLLALEPGLAQRLVGRLAEWVERFGAQQLLPLLLCSTPVRPHVRRLVERVVPSLAVIAPGEIASTTRLRALGVVTLDDAAGSAVAARGAGVPETVPGEAA
jgi:flagellar biosynthesis protein FlhA